MMMQSKVSDLSIYRGLKYLEPDIANELKDFADIIFTLEYDRELANHPIETDAKNRLKALSKDEYEEFAEKIESKGCQVIFYLKKYSRSLIKKKIWD